MTAGRRAGRSALLAAGMAIATLACGHDAPPEGAWRPGDGVFEHLADVRVEAHPATNVPAELAGPVRELLDTGRALIPADAWVPAGGAATKVWQARPSLGPDLQLGPARLHHEGRAALADEAAWPLPGETLGVGWIDALGETRFKWRAADGLLKARRDGRPGETSITYTWSAGSALDRLEQRLRSDGVRPTDARALRCRASLGPVDHDSLLAPAPTTLSLDIDALAADALEVTLGVLDLGFTASDGQLQRARDASDGVTFAVDVTPRGGERTRAWSRHVATLNAYEDVVVDLAPWQGQAVTLRLVTEPGPSGSAAFDYALWAGLRLAGDDRRSPQRPHIVLIDVDTLRADRLGCYGYQRNTTPRLDAWATARAERFADAVATSNWTLPSTASMLTGLAVSQYPVVDFSQALGPEAEPLAQRLGEAGYETRARTDAGLLAPAYGFHHGFQRFDFRREDWLVHQQLGWSEELQRLRSRRSERPVFLFLHTYQVHEPHHDDGSFTASGQPPYDGPFAQRARSPDGLTFNQVEGRPTEPADRRYLDALYDGAVRRMDDVVGAFLEGLPEVFGDEPYVVLFTSDHGEELFERGHLGHGISLHREQLAVPLIVEHPGAGRVGWNPAPTSTLDIVPTILDYAGLPVPEHLPGRSLREGHAGPRVRIAQHGTSAHAIDFDGAKAIVGVVTAFDEATEVRSLFQTRDDPDEIDDRARSEPALIERLERLLRRELQRRPSVGAGLPTTGDAADLRALGYLDDGL